MRRRSGAGDTRGHPMPDEQWRKLVYENDEAFDAAKKRWEQELGRPLTQHEMGRLARHFSQ